ncbi:MAG: hypothetical protein U0401_08495 [Anaerolineae bacterium]
MLIPKLHPVQDVQASKSAVVAASRVMRRELQPVAAQSGCLGMAVLGSMGKVMRRVDAEESCNSYWLWLG